MELIIKDKTEKEILKLLDDNLYFYLINYHGDMFALKDINKKILKKINKKGLPKDSLIILKLSFYYYVKDNMIMSIEHDYKNDEMILKEVKIEE
jgi:hypothetical protein